MKYRVWFEGYIEVDAETDAEACDKAEALIKSHTVVKLNAPYFPKVIDVYDPAW